MDFRIPGMALAAVVCIAMSNTQASGQAANPPAVQGTAQTARPAPFRLDGKVAIVTGAARGIGRSTAIVLARAGATVVGIDIAAPVSASLELVPATPADLAETGRLVEATGARWLSIVADQRDIGALRRAAETASERFGGIDILFANGGVQGFKPLLEMQDEDWHTQIDVNLTGTANAIRAFAPFIVKRGGGRIIATSSTQGQHGTLNGAAYSASKWGIIGLVKSAALEFGRYKITVNALIPGLIDTPLTRRESRYAQMIEASGKTPSTEVAVDEETARASSAAHLPLGVPWISPDDIAPVVLFLASDEARMVSGTTYSATAGDSANLPN